MDNQRYCDVTAAIQHRQDIQHTLVTVAALAGLLAVSVIRYFLVNGGC